MRHKLIYEWIFAQGYEEGLWHLDACSHFMLNNISFTISSYCLTRNSSKSSHCSSSKCSSYSSSNISSKSKSNNRMFIYILHMYRTFFRNVYLNVYLNVHLMIHQNFHEIVVNLKAYQIVHLISYLVHINHLVHLIVLAHLFKQSQLKLTLS